MLQKSQNQGDIWNIETDMSVFFPLSFHVAVTSGSDNYT